MTSPVLLVALIAVLSAGQNPGKYRKLVGQTATICGDVVTFAPPDGDGRGCDMRFDLGSPYWRPSFYVVVPESLRAGLGGRTEDAFFGQPICVTGIVRQAKGIAHIVLDSAEHIQVQASGASRPFGAGAHRPCEPGARAPRLVREVKPDYPSGELVRQQIADRVLLEALVGDDGNVTDVRSLFAGTSQFVPVAEAAVRQWRFRPGTLDGVPVPMIVQVEMNFVLLR